MSFRFTRGALALAVVVAFGLVAIPACKKSKPTQPDSPNPTPNPNPPNPPPNSGQRDPSAPRSPVFTGASEAPMRATARNDMVQIMLGLHNFHDTYGALPAGYADKNGKPGLSWRVAILPFIEQDSLFKQFKLDEPWDSPNNKALISKMPKTFAPPRTDSNGFTFYRGFTGTGAWIPPQQQAARPGQPILAARFTQITDGLSNTILVAEAYDPVIWTKPEEMEFAPNNVPRLGGVFASGFNVGMGDASVRFVRTGIDNKKLAAAIQINDGGLVNLDE